ncbi:uncharacterized protein [Argopecten irradians]|uniref:uncharacterized protein n=1 Tax=Argopecten irradians TaxID=31199 RepID=UPI00371AC919
MKILFIFVVLVLSVHSKDEELPSLQELLNDPELMKMIKRLGITENDLTPKEKPAAVDKPESLASDVDLPKANQPTAAAPTTMKPEYIKDSVGNACYYKTHESTIIRSHESQKAGSLLLRWDGNKTRHECIKSCCYTQGCTLAVFEDKDNNTCYLFNCGENKCAFANHENYVSMTLRESSIVHGGSLGQDNEGDLKGLQKPEKPRPSPTPKPTPVQQKRPVPIFGECDVSLGDKCLDFNAECKQGICQCIRGFKADKGVCYSVPVQTAVHSDPRNHGLGQQLQQQANPALQPNNFQGKLYQGQGQSGQPVQGQGYQTQQQIQSAQVQPVQGQGLQSPIGKQQVSSGLIGSPYQQGSSAGFNNLPIQPQQQQNIQNPVYNDAVGQQANTGFLPKQQQVLPQNGPVMNQQGPYWGSQSGSGFYDPGTGYPRMPGDFGNRPPYTDDLTSGQGLPVRPAQGMDNTQRVFDPHRQYMLQDPTGRDKNYPLDRHYIAEPGPDNQFGMLDRQGQYRNHPYSPFTDDRYDQYTGDVMPDNRFRNEDQYFKDRNYQQSHHKVSGDNDPVKQKPAKPLATTTTTTTSTTTPSTTTTPTTTTTTTAKPTTPKPTTTTTITTPAPQNVPESDRQVQQWGESMTNNRNTGYGDQQINNQGRGHQTLQDNSDINPQRGGQGRVKSNISGKKFRPNGPNMGERMNGPGKAIQTHSNINNQATRPQQPVRPNRVHPNGRKPLRPMGYNQDGYPYYNTDYRGQHFQNYNWDPQYGSDYLTYDTNNYGDVPPAYDYEMFHKDFHRKENPEAPEGIHQAPEQGVTSGPVQTKTEKVTPAASPKVTQQPLIEKVDTVDTQPAAPEKPDTEKSKPETTEGTEKTETEHPPKTSKLADKQKPVTSNTSKSAVEVPSTEKATTKPRKEEKVEVKIGEEDGLVIVEAPNDSNQGPIVALALGLGVTMMLLVYVGCRLRNVKRRIRKGRALHSNEADYLINGMYL